VEDIIRQMNEARVLQGHGKQGHSNLHCKKKTKKLAAVVTRTYGINVIGFTDLKG